MKIGYGKLILEVESPSLLAGYDAKREATVYEDNLELHCLSFDDGKSIMHMVSADVLGIDANIVKDVQYMFPNEHLLIAATHTHSAPGGLWMPNHPVLKDHVSFLQTFNAYQTYLLKDNLVQVIQKAKNNMKPLEHTSVLKIDVKGVSTNRVDPSRKGDDRLIAFKFETEDKSYLFVNYANHPTVLDLNHSLYHPDFVGDFRTALQDKYDGIVYFNGASGDISTRYTRKESSVDESKRLGNILASHIVDSKFESIDFKFEYMKKEVPILKKDETEMVLPIYKLLLGDDTFYGFPLELNSELIQAYKSNYYISYLNDYLMYAAQIESYDNHEYEALMSPFKKGEMERVLKEII